MTQIHLVLRRINPALKIDFVQIGCLLDGRFKELPLSAFESTNIPSFIHTGSISDSLFIYHSEISNLVAELSTSPGFSVEFFDNALIFMFDFNVDPHEITSKEEGKGN